MDEERITLRMGKDELQAMDAYLKAHPESGNRSLLARTAVREYINRDADVPAAPKRSDGIFVGLTKRQMTALDLMLESEEIYSIDEFVRYALDLHFKTEVEVNEAARNAYKTASLDVMQR